jgi:hypothetical protein
VCYLIYNNLIRIHLNLSSPDRRILDYLVKKRIEKQLDA